MMYFCSVTKRRFPISNLLEEKDSKASAWGVGLALCAINAVLIYQILSFPGADSLVPSDQKAFKRLLFLNRCENVR